MKAFLCAIALFFSVPALARLAPVSGSVKTRVVILPPRNMADKSVYRNSEVHRAVIYNSLATFLNVLPDLDVVDENLLTNLPDSASALDIARQFRADAVLSGTFNLSGPKSSPTAAVDWTVTNAADGRELFSRSYRTATDIEIFDTVDAVVADSVRALLNRSVTIAQISFGNFRVGNDAFSVLLNNRTVAVASNDSFSYSQKVPADSKFPVTVRRKSDGKVVLFETVSLRPGEARSFSYKIPSGLQLAYQLRTFRLTPSGYASGDQSWPFGWNGAPRDFLDRLKFSPAAKPFVYGYGANRTLGWLFLAGGGLGTVLTLGTGGQNSYTNLSGAQKGFLALGYLAGTVTCFTLSALFFNNANNDLDKAVWHYNRFILFEAEHARAADEIRIPIAWYAAEF